MLQCIKKRDKFQTFYHFLCQVVQVERLHYIFCHVIDLSWHLQATRTI